MTIETQAPPSPLRRRNFGKNHAYYLRRDDGTEVKLDGVTTLLSNGIPKPALVNWAGNVTAEYAVDNWEDLALLAPSARLKVLKGAKDADRDAAAGRGTEVHALAEKLIAGEEVPVPEELAGHVESCVRFLDTGKIRPILTETSVWHRRALYAGTLDMVFTSDLLPGRVILGDWKTNRSGIYPEVALQLAAYANADYYVGPDGADHEMAGLKITDHWAIWLRADGFSIYPMATSQEAYRTFQYAATVARRTGIKTPDGRYPLDAYKGEEFFFSEAAA
ncbi:hypothetical protein [Gryllotalpicola protaetiae]|uniref:PD-(D/E)XK endonuclease-like domain-containing protein n=1 Tax=Gryllotalpicola protaetiae TaxID=2419771 RepID=A0A387BMZ1_9MICO|nr:hypothetical protein [Gryllotalpicola protaetiae]AYG02400.1 hypothetical protein D7I44_01845 [Gryllotalpicola protaetiae]